MNEPALDDNLPFLVDVARGMTTDAAIAERIANRARDKVVHVDGVFYDWTGARWRRLPDSTIPAFIQRMDGHSTGVWRPPTIAMSARRVIGVTRLLRQRLDAPGFFDTKALGINVANGFVVLEEDGTPSLIAHAREQRQRNIVPVPWQPTTSPGPAWQRLVSSFDAPDVIEAVLGVGLADAPELSDRRLVLVLGAASARRELAALLRGLLGDRAGYVATSELGNGEHLATLIDRPINLSEEVGDEPPSPEFFRLLSGLPLRLRSGLQAGTTSASALHIVMAAMPPRLVEPLPAPLAHRVMIVTALEGDVQGAARSALTDEASGVLHAAITALGRTVGRGALPASHVGDAAVAVWARGADVAGRFLSSGVVVVSSSARVSSAAVHEAYSAWALENRMPSLTLPRLVRMLERTGMVRRTNTGRRRYLAGLRLR